MNVFFHSLQFTMLVSIESKPLSNPNTIKWPDYTIHNCGPLDYVLKIPNGHSPDIYRLLYFINGYSATMISFYPRTIYKYEILYGNVDFDSNLLMPNLAIANNFHGRTQILTENLPLPPRKWCPFSLHLHRRSWATICLNLTADRLELPLQSRKN